MTTDPEDVRGAAIKRLTARRDFGTHLVCYVVFNAALVAIWFFTGQGYFWPAWILAIWGAGLAMHAWDAWGRQPISEEAIRHEIDRRGGGHAGG